ncbi:MAG: hypothetical protein JO016_02940 [Actinobacteria bacterium]|nr:hypothetical protein [Actinomycetota bacterium]
MPALPWSVRASLPPTYACLVIASRQVLRRYRDLPAAYLGQFRAFRRWLRTSDGVLGYALAVRPWSRSFWTVSAWVDEDAAGAATLTRWPGRALAASTVVSWYCLAEELPVGWAEVQQRLRYAAAGRPSIVTGWPVARTMSSRGGVTASVTSSSTAEKEPGQAG